MPAGMNLNGQSFGRLKVIKKTREASPTNGRVWVKWECQCICGNVTYVRSSALKNGTTTSCGCYNRELVLAGTKTHGLSKSREYTSYAAMKKRCSNPKDPAFHNYGGRGISVCLRWKDSFNDFFSDMGLRPPNTSLERINNNGDYEPSNCKWATKKEQQNNMRSNRRLLVKVESLLLKEVSERSGISVTTLRSRLNRGWSDEKTALTPQLKQGSRNKPENRALEGGKKF